MKIYLHGNDGNNWSIDKDRENLLAIFNRCDIRLTEKSFLAKYIHSLWWNLFIESEIFYLKYFTNVNAVCSNFIDPQSKYFMLHDTFNIAKKIVNTWICPSIKQAKILDNLSLKTFYMPFFIDYEFFSSHSGKKNKEICYLYNIPEEILAGKCVIGSFQRDSLGADLRKPKFQKNPDGIIEILKNIDRSKYILLLTGPRRHYIRSQCQKFNIPYYFVGKIVNEDDISINTQSSEVIRDLYQLTDIMICTSVSEGGPKCILESTASGTLCISTDVGLAKDFLPANLVSNDITLLGNIISEYIINKDNFIKLKNDSQSLCKNKLCYEARINYIKTLYKCK